MDNEKIKALIEENRKLGNAARIAFACLAHDNTYNENINYAWRVLGEALGVIHTSELHAQAIADQQEQSRDQ